MMSSSRRRTTEQMLVSLGEQVRDARIDLGIDQATLAARAGVSTSTISKLENGHGSTLETFVRAIRALDRSDWLDDLAPVIDVSPLRMADSAGRSRRRMRVGRHSTVETDPRDRWPT